MFYYRKFFLIQDIFSWSCLIPILICTIDLLHNHHPGIIFLFLKVFCYLFQYFIITSFKKNNVANHLLSPLRRANQHLKFSALGLTCRRHLIFKKIPGDKNLTSSVLADFFSRRNCSKKWQSQITGIVEQMQLQYLERINNLQRLTFYLLLVLVITRFLVH